MAKRQLRSRVKERARDTVQPATKPLPDIANPLPQGFAFDDEDLDFFSAAQAEADGVANRTADADSARGAGETASPTKRSLRLPRPNRSPKPARAEEPLEDNGAEMMNFLDSVYGTD